MVSRKKLNCRDRKQISVYQWLGVGRGYEYIGAFDFDDGKYNLIVAVVT